jgi:hypothetical protein
MEDSSSFSPWEKAGMREVTGSFVPKFCLTMLVTALTLPLPEGEGQNPTLFSFNLDHTSN